MPSNIKKDNLLKKKPDIFDIIDLIGSPDEEDVLSIDSLPGQEKGLVILFLINARNKKKIN